MSADRIQGGSTANRTRKQLERFIKDRLQDKGYEFIAKNRFMTAKALGKPIYTKQYVIGKSIYDTKLSCDFILYHPQKFPDCLVIEAKWQQSGGSADEKYPYLVANIKEKSPYNTIIIIDGGGYKEGALNWLKNQKGDNLLGIFTMSEFQTWVNKGNL